MISMSEKHDVLYKYFYDGLGKQTIAKQMGLSKNTVKKYITSFEESKEKLLKKGVNISKDKMIEMMVEEPKYDASSRSNTVVTHEMLDKLKAFITENERKLSLGIRKQSMNAQTMYESLIDSGFKVSYPTVVRHVRKLIGDRKNEAFIKQIYEYGEVCEFDWGEVKLEIAGKLKSFRMAAFATAKGNYRFAVLYRKEQMQHFLDAHVKFFEHVGGVYKTVVYDNMKVAVANFVGPHEKEATVDLKKIALYYGFNYRFCNVRSGNEKGHVEKSVEYIRQQAFSGNIRFNSDEDANKHLEAVLAKLNNYVRKYLDNKSPREVLEDEKQYLIHLLPTYDVAKVTELRVDKYSTIIVEGNRYSVPDTLVGKFVTVKIYTDKLNCYYDKNEVASHTRNYGQQQWTMTIEHYKNTLLKKPGALPGSLAFSQLSEQLKSIFTEYYKDAPKDFVHLIELISENGVNKILSVIDKLKQKHIQVNTEHIKVFVNNTDNISYYIVNKDDVNTEIEKNCRNALKTYGSMLTNDSELKEAANA